MGRKKIPLVKFCILAELTIEEGLALIKEAQTVSALYVNGERVKRDKHRLAVILNSPLECSICGYKATHFRIDRHRNDNVMPFSLNLYASSRLMTWDHILPRSHGGSDHIANGRLACDKCNFGRGNTLLWKDFVWVCTHPNQLRLFRDFREEFEFEPWGGLINKVREDSKYKPLKHKSLQPWKKLQVCNDRQ